MLSSARHCLLLLVLLFTLTTLRCGSAHHDIQYYTAPCVIPIPEWHVADTSDDGGSADSRRKKRQYTEGDCIDLLGVHGCSGEALGCCPAEVPTYALLCAAYE